MGGLVDNCPFARGGCDSARMRLMQYARYLIGKSGYCNPSPLSSQFRDLTCFCIFLFWFSLVHSLVRASCVHHLTGLTPSACLPHCVSLDSVKMGSAFQTFQTGQRGDPNPPFFSWLCSDMTAGQPFTCGHHARKETFWNSRGRKTSSFPGRMNGVI